MDEGVILIYSGRKTAWWDMVCLTITGRSRCCGRPTREEAAGCLRKSAVSINSEPLASV
jgi:hypothetical protein